MVLLVAINGENFKSDSVWHEGSRQVDDTGPSHLWKRCQHYSKVSFTRLLQVKFHDVQELHSTIEDIYEANIESDRGVRERIRFYDTAGLRHSNDSGATTQLPRQYLQLADGYLLVYDTNKPDSLDVLVSIKKDVDKNRDKKEVRYLTYSKR